MARWTSRFRRSKSLGGGFRLNLTKRGIGISAGGRGLRQSWHSTGRRTTSAGIPGTGVSWEKVERVGSNVTASQGRRPFDQPPPVQSPTDRDDLIGLARRAQREIEGDP